MNRPLDLGDIQGNVTRAYGRFSFPFARYFFLHLDEYQPEKARAFIDALRPKVTTATRWTKDTKPDVTLNIGFTWFGLYALGVPYRTLQGMPEEFIAGMKARAFILGDSDTSEGSRLSDAWCKHWDPIWKGNRARDRADDVHVWISMNAQAVPVDGKPSDTPHPALEEQTEWLRGLVADSGGAVRLMGGTGADGSAEYQDANAVFADLPGGAGRVPVPKEHFGLTDGIGDPVYAGQYPADLEKSMVIGRGKWMDPKIGWEPLATGEFVLGYPDEAQELPPVARPWPFSRNGSFMAYRKLHENVSTWHAIIDEEAETFAKVQNVDAEEARETLIAKIVGRWADGVPLSRVPTYPEWRAFQAQKGFGAAAYEKDPIAAARAYEAYLKSAESSDFKYGDDMQGLKCPVGAHMRRVNTRDHLDPANSMDGDNPDARTMLSKRRRVLRRGLPYGPTMLGEGDDSSEQGVIFMALCASLFRQFEFVQQQWIQYGLDFDSGNNTCPLLGTHERFRRHVIPADPDSGKSPFVVSKLKTFIECRGGDYFFLPSMTSLRMIAMGTIDPT